MTKITDAGEMTHGTLAHSAFPTSLTSFEVVAKFWTELRRILPANELHVIDPYILDDGGMDPATYARDVVSLLGPALRVVNRVVVVYGKPRQGIRELLARDIALVNSETDVQFHKGSEMHARYLVADRSRALRMDFSFNRIGKSFGTVSLVEDIEDIAGIVVEIGRLHPVTGA